MRSRAFTATAIAAAIVAVAGLVTTRVAGHHSTDAVTAWRLAAARALGGPGFATLQADVMSGAADWTSGTLDTAAFRSAETQHLGQFVAIRDRVAALPAFPGGHLVSDLYAQSAELEVEWVRLTLDLADLPAGAARDQLDLLTRRVGELADRARTLASAQPTGVADVPNWVDEGLAPGPPLDAAAAPPAASLAPPSAARPTGPRAAWLAAVAGAPSPSAVAGAIYADDPTAAQHLARGLVAKAAALGGVPDPVPGSEAEAASIRLGLLVDADAARGSQLATVAHLDELVASAQRLLVIGASMWSPDLGPHTTSLDPRILLGNGR